MFMELSHASKTYGKSQSGGQCQALKDVSLCIDKGEMIAIVGKSGSGKTTLLNILGLLDRADKGSYTFDGEDMGQKKECQLSAIRNQKMGFVLQDFALVGNMTVYDNIAIPLYLSNCKNRDIHKRVCALAASVGLQEILGKKAKFLSGGQKQRVAIARAISKHPLLILADEPTGSLDSKTAADIISLLKSIHKSGTTVVLVTHDMDIAACCERTVHMEDGVLSP